MPILVNIYLMATILAILPKSHIHIDLLNPFRIHYSCEDYYYACHLVLPLQSEKLHSLRGPKVFVNSHLYVPVNGPDLP